MCIELVNYWEKHNLSSTIFFNLSLYQITCKNTVELDRSHMTIWRVRISLCVPKATNIFKIYKTSCFPTSTVVARPLLNVSLYVSLSRFNSAQSDVTYWCSVRLRSILHFLHNFLCQYLTRTRLNNWLEALLCSLAEFWERLLEHCGLTLERTSMMTNKT